MTTPHGVLVPAPVVTPYPYGLLSVAQFPQEGDPHWPTGIVWDELGAAQAFTSHGWAAPPLGAITHSADGNSTSDEGVPTDGTASILVYALIDVSPVGRDAEAAAQLARTKMSYAAPRALEAAIWTGKDSQAVATGAKHLAAGTDTTDLTAATAVGASVGLGLLEEWLGDNYAGVGVVHAGRKVSASFDEHRLACLTGGKKTTGLGNLIAFGAGYDGSAPDGTAAAAGTSWLYATAGVAVRQGEDLLAPVDAAHAFGYSNNSVVMAVQRQYAVSWEAGVAAALINLGA